MLRQLVNDISGCRRVVNHTVGQQKEDLVLVRSLLGAHQVEEFGQEGSEKSGTTKADLRERLTVYGRDLLDTCNRWILWVSIEGEAVTNSINANVPWDTSKSKDREHSVVIVRFDDLTYIEDGSLVLIVLTQIMK